MRPFLFDDNTVLASGFTADMVTAHVPQYELKGAYMQPQGGGDFKARRDREGVTSCWLQRGYRKSVQFHNAV
jgi:hypothetical protein